MIKTISLRSAALCGLMLILIFVGRMGGGWELGSCTAPKFPSKMISKIASIVLDAPSREVFPLFGPIEESKWTYDWNPDWEVAINHHLTTGECLRMEHSPEGDSTTGTPPAVAGEAAAGRGGLR